MSDYERERELRIRAEEDHRAAVEGLETYEARIRDIADHVLGIQPADVPSIVLLDAIEREAGRRRIAQLQAEAERDRLRDLLRECVHVHDGTHSEDCHAFGAGGDEEIDPEWTSPDPHCDCGALAKREAFRKALGSKEIAG